MGVETVRYYERIGLLKRPVAPRGYRHYPDETVAAVRFIKNAQRFGFSLREIRDLLGMTRSQVSCEEMCGRIGRKLTDLDDRIAALQQLRSTLAALLAHSPKTGPYSNCEVYGALSGAGSQLGAGQVRPRN